MSAFLTAARVPLDFKGPVELNSVFDRGNLKHPDGMRGELYLRDDNDVLTKFDITAREKKISPGCSKVVYDLTPAFDFHTTCLNVFRAMLNVLMFRIAKYRSPELTHEANSHFEKMLDERQALTRFPMLEETIKLVGEGDTPDQWEQVKISDRLAKIHAAAKEFAACRSPEASVDVVIRMERAGYKEGLFSNEDGGHTQPVVERVKDHELTEKLKNKRFMMLKDGGTKVCFDDRAYTSPKDVEESIKEPMATWSKEQRAEWESAVAQEGKARDLAEKLCGGGWTKEQVTLFAAAMDEASFVSKYFGLLLGECPGNDSADRSAQAGDLLRQYGEKLGVPPRLTPGNQKLDGGLVLEEAFRMKNAVSEDFRNDQMFRKYFVDQVASDPRLTKGMTPEQKADVVETFSTASVNYC